MSDYKIHYYALNRILSFDGLNTGLTLNRILSSDGLNTDPTLNFVFTT